MTKEELSKIKDELREVIVQAHQAGKKETSGLASEFASTIARMETNLKNFINTATEKLNDHEGRIRVNEESRIRLYAIAGFLVLIGGVGSWFIVTSLEATVEDIVDDNTRALKQQVDSIPQMIQDYYEVSLDNV